MGHRVCLLMEFIVRSDIYSADVATMVLKGVKGSFSSWCFSRWC